MSERKEELLGSKGKRSVKTTITKTYFVCVCARVWFVTSCRSNYRTLTWGKRERRMAKEIVNRSVLTSTKCAKFMNFITLVNESILINTEWKIYPSFPFTSYLSRPARFALRMYALLVDWMNCLMNKAKESTKNVCHIYVAYKYLFFCGFWS